MTHLIGYRSMKQFAILALILGLFVAAPALALRAYDSSQHIVLVRMSDDEALTKYYDYDADIVCYVARGGYTGTSPAISCLRLSVSQ